MEANIYRNETYNLEPRQNVQKPFKDQLSSNHGKEIISMHWNLNFDSNIYSTYVITVTVSVWTSQFVILAILTERVVILSTASYRLL